MPTSPPLDLVLLAAAVEAAGFPAPVFEFRFHPTRKWAFDFALPSLMVAFEREGFGPRGGAGRHQRANGYAGDAEKYSEAAIAGWCVIRATGRQIESGLAADLVLRAMADRGRTRGVVLGLAERIAAQSELLGRRAERRTA